MNAAFILLACVPTQFGEETTSYIIPRVEIGPRVQNRNNIMRRRFFNTLKIQGDNNVVIISYRPTDQGLYYYNKQKRVTRRPLFRRFRRTYP